MTKDTAQTKVHQMVNNNEQQLNLIFSALSDPTRRAMLMRLNKQEMSIAELSRPFDMSKSAITKHVKILESTGLLKRTVEGRVHYCQLESQPLKTATDWMGFYKKFWNDAFDGLDEFLSGTSSKDQE